MKSAAKYSVHTPLQLKSAALLKQEHTVAVSIRDRCAIIISIAIPHCTQEQSHVNVKLEITHTHCRIVLHIDRGVCVLCSPKCGYTGDL